MLRCLFPAARSTRADWVWTWASRSALATSLKARRPAAAELLTVQTHCPPVHGSVSLTRTHPHRQMKGHRLGAPVSPFKPFQGCHSCIFFPGSSSNVQYRTERIKIPSTPRYPRSMLGSDRGILCSSIWPFFFGFWFMIGSDWSFTIIHVSQKF